MFLSPCGPRWDLLDLFVLCFTFAFLLVMISKWMYLVGMLLFDMQDRQCKPRMYFVILSPFHPQLLYGAVDTRNEGKKIIEKEKVET